MLSERFNHLFVRLTGAFVRHQAAPRRPDAIALLGAARWDLELARRAIGAERARLTRAAVAASPPRRTSVSPTDLARLRAQGVGM